MFGSAARGLALAILVFSSQAVAQQLEITTGDSTWSIGRIEWRLDATGGSGGGYQWSVIGDTLPPGVALRTDIPGYFGPGSTAGLIGVATSAGTYNINLRVDDSGGNFATKTITLKILGLVTTSDWVLADASIGVPYSNRITTAGSTGDVTFALQPGQNLPPGLSLDTSTGDIAGIPGLPAGDYYFGVDITDSTGTIGRGFYVYVSPMHLTSSGSLPNATQDMAYSHSISVAGGSGPYNYAFDCCSPEWLSLNSSTGVLGGTPGYPGYWAFTVVITDSTGALLRKHYQLGVIGVPPVLPGITTPYFPDVTVGELIVWGANINGGTPPYTWSVPSGELPPGMTVEDVPNPRPYWNVPGAWLWGTPATEGEFTFTVRVTDSSSPPVSTEQSYTIRSSALSFDGLPEANFGTNYSEKVRVVGGVQPYSVVTTQGKLPSGLTIDSKGLVSGTPKETGAFWFEIKATDNSGAPNTVTRGNSINVATNPRSSVDIQGGDLGYPVVNQYARWNLWAWGGSGTYNWSLEPGSSLPPGFDPLSNSPGSYVVLSGTPTVTGTHSFLLRATDVANAANFAVRAFRMSVTSLRLTVVSTNLPWTNVGGDYSTTLTVTGNTGSVVWTLEPGYSLPPGLSLSPDGILSGTPASAGQYWIQLRAADGATGESVSWGFFIAIYPPGMIPPLSITTSSDLGTWSIGRVQCEVSAQGGHGNYAWGLTGSLPPGLSLRTDGPPWFSSQTSAGLIGVATTPGTYNFTLQVTDGTSTFSRAFKVKVVDLLIKDPWYLPEASQGEPYSFTFSRVGSGTAIWSWQGGDPLPPGLTLTSEGVLSGIPTIPGSYNFSVFLFDGTDTVSRGYNLTVQGFRITTPRILPNAKLGKPYSLKFAVSGASGAVTWNADWTPPGLTLLPDGTLTGTPSNSWSWAFWITATDASKHLYSAVYYLNVVGDPPNLPGLSGDTSYDITLGDGTWIGFSAYRGTAPFTWSATGMPPGMSLQTGAIIPTWHDPAGSLLWGTPTALGTYNVTITATDSSAPPITVSQTYSVRVTALAPDSNDVPYGTRGSPYRATLRMIGGLLPYSWSVASGVLPAGLTLNAGNGVVSGTPLENGTECPRITTTTPDAKTYTNYYCFSIGGGTTTVNIENGSDLGSATLNQSYSTTLSASGAPSYTWSLEPGSSLPPGLDLRTDGVISGTPTQKGEFSFLVRAADAAYTANYGIRRFVLNVTPLRITSSGDLSWTNVGTAYSTTPKIAGNVGSVVWSLQLGSALPPGLGLDPSTGRISGTPSSAGYYSFGLVVSDPAGSTSCVYWFSISIYPVGLIPPLSLNLGFDLGTTALGPNIMYLEATGGYSPYVYSYAPDATPIPGMRVQNGPPLPANFPQSSAGWLGVLAAPGTWSTTIRVTDSKGQVFDRTVTLGVSPLMPATTDWLPRAIVGMAYSFEFTATGGTAPYSWSVQPWSPLPPGISSLTSRGVLTGTPTSAGTYGLGLLLSDADGNSLYCYFVLEVEPFAITTASVLPQGTVDSPYSVKLAADAPGVTWSIYNGGLPGGLSLDPSTGVISGTPGGSWYSWFTVRATDSGGRSSLKKFSLAIVEPTPQPLSISTTSPLPDEVIGETVEIRLDAWGGSPPYSWTLEPSSDLPAGLVVVNDGESACYWCGPGLAYLIGRPIALGDYTFTLRITDSALPANTTTRTFTVHVASVSVHYQDLPLSGTTLIYNTPYTQPMLGLGGTGTYTWVAEEPLPPGLTLSPSGVISGTPVDTGGFSTLIRITDGAGATMSRRVYFNVASGTTQTLYIDVGPDLGTTSQGYSYGRDLWASGSPLPAPNYTFSALTSLPPGCTLLSGNAMTGGTSAPARLACNPSSSGTFNFTLEVQDATGNLGVRTFTLRVTPNAIFTGSSGLANAATGMSYWQRLIGWGASGTWSVAPGSSLPPGLTLANDGTISGTPTATGDYWFTVLFTDASGLSVSRNFRILVAGLGIKDPRIIPTQAIAGEFYTYTFSAEGGGASKTWSVVGSLPYGMSLSSSGILSGTTGYDGNYTFNIQVTDGVTTFTKRFSLVVRQKYPFLRSAGNNPVNLGDVAVGQSFSASLSNAGGVPPYTWSVASSPSLPPGLSFVRGADLPANYNPIATLLAGTPTDVGQYTFTLLLTDSAGAYTQRTFQLNVSPLATVSSTLRDPVSGTPYSQMLTMTGGTAPYSFALTSGALPPGLTLSPGGLISGTTTDTGNFSFMVRVTDSAARVFNRWFYLYVEAPPPQETLDIYPNSLPDLSAGVGSTTDLYVYGGVPPYTWDLSSGILPPGLALVSGAEIGYDQGSYYLSGQCLTPGVSTFTLSVTDSAGNVGYRTFTQRVSALQVLQPIWSAASTGAAVNLQLTAAGGIPPHSFALAPGSSMPLGLTLGQTGSITGTVTESGSYSLSFIVTDASGQSLTTARGIRVYPAGSPIPLQVSSSDGMHLGGETATASVNADFLQPAVVNSGAPPYSLTLQLGSLPPKMVLVNQADLANAYLTGAPTSAGTYDYILRLGSSGSQTLDLQVSTTVVSLNLTPDPIPPATVGTAYSLTFVPTGGKAAYGLQLANLSWLPPGLTLSGMTLSGTPTNPGHFPFALTLRDSTGAELTRNFDFYVDSATTSVNALSTSPANVQVVCITAEVPAPVPINITSGAGSVDFTATVAGISGASLSATSGKTPQSVNLLLPSSWPNGNGTYYGVIEINSAQAPNAPLPVRVVVTVVPRPVCRYTVSPATVSIDAAGGPGSLNVSSVSNCNWTVTTPDSWIKITSPASGSGNGTVTYSLSPNTGATSRTGTVSVSGGQTHTITQFGSTCAYTLNPTAVSMPAAGGSGTIAVNSSLANCAWTAASNAPDWIQVTSGSSGTGSGSVSISVSANTDASKGRSGTVTIAGLSFSVSQPVASCTVSLSSGGSDVPATGGTGSVIVTTNNCGYTTVNGPSWITVTDGGSGSGSGTLNYSVAANSSTQARSGSFLVGGQPYQIVQAGMACSFTITSDNTIFGASGGNGAITVQPNGSNCGWTASSTSGDPAWLKITAGSTGAGSGKVSYSVDSYVSSTGRSGSIIVAGQTVTITQSGVACSYSLRSPEGIMPAAGGTGAVGLVTAPGCTWNATGDSSSWIQITSASGTGSGDVAYSIQPNTSAAERTGTLTIAGQTYLITQLGLPCSYTLSPTSTVLGPDGVTPDTPGASFGFTANRAGCTPKAVSLANWIAVSTEFDGTNGTVRFGAAANPLNNSRSGLIQVGDQVFTVQQTASACSFSLNAYGAIYNNAGGSDSVLASASAVCPAPAIGASPELIPLLGPLTQDPLSRIWTQPYTVPPFDSFNPWIRVLQISVSGEIFTIKQTSWQ